jgi:hypothetical protein
MALLKFIFIFYVTISMTTLMVYSLSIQKDKCGDGQAPLAGYFCGRGINHHSCPSTHRCVIAPNDAYAVCCPNREQEEGEMVARSTEKAGSCRPPPPVKFGICIARCSIDSDCPGTHKCCGSCPRQCSSPIFH